MLKVETVLRLRPGWDPPTSVSIHELKYLLMRSAKVHGLKERQFVILLFLGVKGSLSFKAIGKTCKTVLFFLNICHYSNLLDYFILLALKYQTTYRLSVKIAMDGLEKAGATRKLSGSTSSSSGRSICEWAELISMRTYIRKMALTKITLREACRNQPNLI